MDEHKDSKQVEVGPKILMPLIKPPVCRSKSSIRTAGAMQFRQEIVSYEECKKHYVHFESIIFFEKR